MPRNATCYEVLIASPGDVLAERQIVVECIEDWNSAHSIPTGIILQPRRWELDSTPEMAERPQDAINRQIVDSSDILIGVFWHRLGAPTGVSESGTVEEISRLVAAGKPVSLYFSQSPVPINLEQDQLAALRAYKSRMSSTALYFEFENPEILRRLVSRHLATRMHQLARTPEGGRIAELEAALLRIHQKVRDREVAPEQVENLKRIAYDCAKGAVTIQKLDQDPEAVKYAQQLFNALEVAGWTPSFAPGRVIGGMPIGLKLHVISTAKLEITSGAEATPLIPPSSPVFYGQALKNSLEAVGIAVDHFEVTSGPPVPRDSVYLAIGHKP